MIRTTISRIATARKEHDNSKNEESDDNYRRMDEKSPQWRKG